MKHLFWQPFFQVHRRTFSTLCFFITGSKQWLQKTYKNLEQRVQLECDGYRIPLPHLQGIVILNIPRYLSFTNVHTLRSS